MIKLYAVTINLDALKERLRPSRDKPASQAQAILFLKALGFAQTKWPGVFVGSADAAAHLESGEVVSVKAMGQ